MNISFKTWKAKWTNACSIWKNDSQVSFNQLRNLLIAVISLISLIVYETPLIVH